MKKLLSGLSAFFLALGSLSPAAAQSAAGTPYPSFADLVEKLSPSVVNISTTQKPENLEGGDVVSLKNLPENKQISPLGQEHYTLGSGFLLDEEGYIITNSHVIDRADKINVILSDNSQHQAKVIGTDNKTDLALIKIDTDKKLMPVNLGDSDKIRVGDWILAIGNPFGLGGSVTAGIVSAKSRDIESGPYDNFIQTDASINQGSSGGPMFNLDGEVIGINAAIFSTTGGNMGISFAIPVNNAKFVIRELKNSGSVKRGWIGVRVQPQLTEANSVGNIPNGILISSVAEGSPAADAGIQAGDIILALNEQDMDSAQIFSRLVSESPVKGKITLKLWHNGQIENRIVNVEEMPAETNGQETAVVPEHQAQTDSAAPTAEKQQSQTPPSEQSLGQILNEAVKPQPENKPEQQMPPVEPQPAAAPQPPLPESAAAAPAPSDDIADIAPDIAPADVNEKASYTIPGSGMMVRNITIQDINEMELKADTMGVIVVSTIPNSEAAVKGIRPGLIITKINKRNIYNTDSAKSAVYEKTENDQYTFMVQDGEHINTVTLNMKVK
ncbi:MAG: trypsin-like peptidase domain-containing protein [Alphaproteobacteria bacterium]|nr:trypsin-like peptidase domain-containing protein [Alphaproteobacteria bacterium]